jgi:hypothetical protein
MSGYDITVENTEVQIKNLENLIHSRENELKTLKYSLELLRTFVLLNKDNVTLPVEVENKAEIKPAVENKTEIEPVVEDKVEDKVETEVKVEAEAKAKTPVKTKACDDIDAEFEIETVVEDKIEPEVKTEVKIWADEVETLDDTRSWVFAAHKGRSVTPAVSPAGSPAKSNNSRLHLVPLFSVPDLEKGKYIAPFLQALTDGFKSKGNKSKDGKLDNCDLCKTNVKNLYVVCKNGSLDVGSGWTSPMPGNLKEITERVVTSLNDSNTHELLFVHVDETREKPYTVFAYQRRYTTSNSYSNSRY